MITLENELENWISYSGITLFEHQEESFNVVNSGSNLLLFSATGTGKTLSAFLPILNEIIKKKKRKNRYKFCCFLYFSS